MNDLEKPTWLAPSLCATVILGICALALAVLIRGCANEHSREHGHGNITFDVSPDGTKLVFNAVGLGGRDLFLLDLNTLAITPIGKSREYEVDPRFSPEGRQIVYAAGKPGDRADHIFVRVFPVGEQNHLAHRPRGGCRLAYGEIWRVQGGCRLVEGGRMGR